MNSSNIDPTNEIAGLVISPGASRLRGTAICRRWIAACLALGMLALAPLTEHLSAQSQGRGSKPVPVSYSQIVPASTIQCGFDVELSFSGKSGFINLPGDRIILTSPAFNVSVTNLSDPTKSVSLNVTGVIRLSPQGSNTLVTFTGRNLLTDPGVGLFLLIGQYTLLVDSNNNVVRELSGNGQVINVCDLLQ